MGLPYKTLSNSGTSDPFSLATYNIIIDDSVGQLLRLGRFKDAFGARC